MGIIVAIDGPAGAGKSSTAKEVAFQLGFVYIDTGAMYRAVTLEVIRSNVDVSNENQVTLIAKKSNIQFRWINKYLHTFLNSEDVSDEIRSSEVADLVSSVSAIPGVRDVMVKCQREMAKRDNIVMEGRDIGTNVFPSADFKFYLDADIDVRAKRRISDYKKIGQELTLEEIKKEIKIRDKIDSSRRYSPLKKAYNAIIIDTTNLSFKEQVEMIVNRVKKVLS
ncbi:MAG: (d)CMP kinase [Candidatus Marinimicrobia bacterium]|nr:(d)CMP kinase [Candidatus Neomarinimicrobiota bacterium]MCK4447617.1 (d)CMP kinase [Candidatus Neomarinimicrobiota bacterium]